MCRNALSRCRLVGAAVLALASIASAQTTPRLKYEQAIREMERGNLPRAQALLEECIAQQPEPGEVTLGKGEVLRYVPQLLLGRVLADQGKVEEARRRLQEFERYPSAGQLGGRDLVELQGRLRTLAAPKLLPPFRIEAPDGLCRVKWEAVPGAEAYRLEISSSMSFDAGKVSRELSRFTSRILARELQPGETVYVRVAAEVGGAVGEFSATAACVHGGSSDSEGLRLQPAEGMVAPGEWITVGWSSQGEGAAYEVRCLAGERVVSNEKTTELSARCQVPDASSAVAIEVTAMRPGSPPTTGRAAFTVQARVQAPTLRWEPVDATLWWSPVAMASRYLVRWGKGDRADTLLERVDSCSPRRCSVTMGELGAGAYAVEVIAVSASPTTHRDSEPASAKVLVPAAETLAAYANARELTNAGEYSKALIAFAPLQSQLAGSPQFQLYLGIAAFGCERLGEGIPSQLGSSAAELAEQSFARAKQLDPNLPFPVESFGRLFHEAFVRAASASVR